MSIVQSKSTNGTSAHSALLYLFHGTISGIGIYNKMSLNQILRKFKALSYKQYARFHRTDLSFMTKQSGMVHNSDGWLKSDLFNLTNLLRSLRRIDWFMNCCEKSRFTKRIISDSKLLDSNNLWVDSDSKPCSNDLIFYSLQFTGTWWALLL